MGSGAHRVYLLNETATVLWQALRRPVTTGELGSLLAERFAVSPGRAVRDAREIVGRLVRQGLVEVSAQEG